MPDMRHFLINVAAIGQMAGQAAVGAGGPEAGVKIRPPRPG